MQSRQPQQKTHLLGKAGSGFRGLCVPNLRIGILVSARLRYLSWTKCSSYGTILIIIGFPLLHVDEWLPLISRQQPRLELYMLCVQNLSSVVRTAIVFVESVT